MAIKLKHIDLKSEIDKQLNKYHIAVVELKSAIIVLNQDPTLLLSNYKINKDIVNALHDYDLYQDIVSVEDEHLKKTNAIFWACKELEKIANLVEKELGIRLKIYNKNKIAFFKD